MEILTTRQLSKTFGTQAVIQNMNLSIQQGKCVALIGANGAGKTTTLRILAGLIKPSEGEVTYEHTQKDFRKIVGYVPQSPQFYEWMSGEEYLIHAARLTDMKKTKAAQRAEELLKEMNIFTAKNKRISSYSGGMKQRLGIAQALIHRPQILLLDEPVSALDPVGRREVLNFMKQLKGQVTILFSTHILSDADEVCDDVILLHEGNVIEDNSMTALREKYKTSVIELTFSENREVYLEQVRAFPFVHHVQVIRGTFHLAVNDIASAKTAILSKAVEMAWPLTSFRINYASLEDMFLKAVEK